MRPSDKLVLLILVLAVGETAWALFAAETSLNILLFYVVLVALSLAFVLIPGLDGEASRRSRR
jgi:hypothetical protein